MGAKDERGWDVEAVKLCDAMNLLPGVQTTESCCGHGKRPFRIWFLVDGLEALPPLRYWVDRCHSGIPGWTVTARTDCAMSPVSFMLEGPIGAFDDADAIATLINTWRTENANQKSQAA